DAGFDAGPPPPPPCGEPAAPGTIRWQASDVLVGGAFGVDGNVYATVRGADDAIDLASFDRCTGALRWQRPALPTPERRGAVRRPRVRFTDAGDVLAVNGDGYLRLYGVWRYGLDGEARAPYAIPDSMVGFYAVPTGRGPLVQTYADEVGHTVQMALDGSVAAIWDDSISPTEECIGSGDVMLCYGGAYRLPDGAPIWTHSSTELVDGTFRHVVPPATDGRRLYAIVYGISSYWFDAIDRSDGSRIFRVPLMHTTRGQNDLRLGRPLIDADGSIYVYANGHRDDAPYTGALIAFDRDGAERWRFVADASLQEFFLHATHVLGDAGLVYLAIGDGVHALDTRDGTEVWALPTERAVNTPQIALGPGGDLLVHTDDDELLVIATESTGLAAAPWPAPAGDLRNANAR
ncbi:MAG: PQQ-binding-like beta-propeller repeat protein, partial [Myxococcales bacterium]|nr:PQQ-binding-like beta-propeller repeat protein [Myxococcales bacterium]